MDDLDRIPSSMLWLFIGLLNAVFVFLLSKWFKDVDIKITPVKWVLLIIYWIFLNLLFSAAFTLVGENESMAALKFLAFFAIPMMLMGILLARWILIGINSADEN